MSSCASIDSLVTPYVDGELPDVERLSVEQHIGVCARCRSRVAAEQTVRELLKERKTAFCADAPAPLRARCSRLAALEVAAPSGETAQNRLGLGGRALVRGVSWRSRLAPLAAAASLVLIVGGAFLYQASERSSRLMASQLAADHMKCFAMNAVLGAHHSAETVQSSMTTGFGWDARLPKDAGSEGLELVGSRTCLYGGGKVAHIMYRHHGQPVSLFMLPRSARPEQLVDVMGHECAIWSSADRTFVLVAREPRSDVQRLAAFVRAALQ